MADLDEALAGMERSARRMLRTIDATARAVRNGEEMSPEHALAILEIARMALRGALGLVDRFQVVEAQAWQAVALAQGSGALNRALLDDLGRATLQAETAIGAVPELHKRN